MEKVIMHYDMDCFYAQVMVKLDKSLSGKPLIVGASPNERGVVATCSYEARKYGIHSGMGSYEAKKKCGNAIFIHPDMKEIKKEADKIAEIAKIYSDKVEFIALDEAYIDLTFTNHLFFKGDVRKIANDLQERVYEETELTCSVGLGYNKFSAKIGSNYNKPRGFADFRDKEKFMKIIINKPVDYIYGVGNKVKNTLNRHRIYTVKDIQITGKSKLRSIFGVYGIHLYNLANGIDNREVISKYEEKGIGNSRTLFENIFGIEDLKKAIIPVVKESAYRLKSKGKYCRTITVRIKYYDFSQITRAKTLKEAINRPVDIYEEACKIIEEKVDNYNNIRLVGIRLNNLTNHKFNQLTIFSDVNKIKKVEKIDDITFNLRKKYGYNIIKDPFDYLVENT